MTDRTADSLLPRAERRPLSFPRVSYRSMDITKNSLVFRPNI